jgi:glycosyltransferase involved in cell wall biosynthesis
MNDFSEGKTIAVITATYNSESVLPELIASLIAQSDQDFEWIVRDGGSIDATASLVRAAGEAGLKVSWFSEPDFGIYDALNRGIRDARATHYLVAGSDDRFDADAIQRYKSALLEAEAPFVVANIRSGSQVIRPKGGSLLLNKQWSFLAGHSLGVLIAKDMHEKYGYYSKKYPIAADQLFLEKAYLQGEVFYYTDFVAGTFGTEGISSTDVLGSLCESLRIHIELTGNVVLNLGVFILRVLKNLHRLR